MKKRARAYDGANIKWEQHSVRSPHVTFGQVCYRPGGYCGPRVQRDYQLVLLRSGSCRLRVGGERRALAVGDVHLLTPGNREHFRFDGETQTHHVWCAAAPGSLPHALRARLTAVGHAACRPSECFERLLSSAFLLRTGRSPAAHLVVDALAGALFAEFLNMAERGDDSGDGSDAGVRRAVRHMEDHLAESDCLLGAQRAAGYSVNALIYKFREALGATPARHLWRLRTEKGIELLGDTGLSAAEIAARCGFKNPFHFSRAVKRLQGIPPREIRRRAWA